MLQYTFMGKTHITNNYFSNIDALKNYVVNLSNNNVYYDNLKVTNTINNKHFICYNDDNIKENIIYNIHVIPIVVNE